MYKKIVCILSVILISFIPTTIFAVEDVLSENHVNNIEDSSYIQDEEIQVIYGVDPFQLRSSSGKVVFHEEFNQNYYYAADIKYNDFLINDYVNIYIRNDGNSDIRFTCSFKSSYVNPIASGRLKPVGYSDSQVVIQVPKSEINKHASSYTGRATIYVKVSGDYNIKGLLRSATY